MHSEKVKLILLLAVMCLILFGSGFLVTGAEDPGEVVVIAPEYNRFIPEASHWNIQFALAATNESGPPPRVSLASVTLNGKSIDLSKITVTDGSLRKLPVVRTGRYMPRGEYAQEFAALLSRPHISRLLPELAAPASYLSIPTNILDIIPNEEHTLVITFTNETLQNTFTHKMTIVSASLTTHANQPAPAPNTPTTFSQNPVNNQGDTQKWVAGDLHIHSTWSDGQQNAAHIRDKMTDRGYHFVYLTDAQHNLGTGRVYRNHEWAQYKPSIRNSNVAGRANMFYGGETDVGRTPDLLQGHLLFYGVEENIEDMLNFQLYATGDDRGRPQPTIERTLRNNPGYSSSSLAHTAGVEALNGDMRWTAFNVWGFSGMELFTGPAQGRLYGSFDLNSADTQNWMTQISRHLNHVLEHRGIPNSEWSGTIPGARTGTDWHGWFFEPMPDFVTWVLVDEWPGTATSHFEARKRNVDRALYKSRTVASRGGSLGYFTITHNGVVYDIGNVIRDVKGPAYNGATQVAPGDQITFDITFINKYRAGNHRIRIFQNLDTNPKGDAVIFDQNVNLSIGQTFSTKVTREYPGGNNFYWMYVEGEDYIYTTPIYLGAPADQGGIGGGPADTPVTIPDENLKLLLRDNLWYRFQLNKYNEPLYRSDLERLTDLVFTAGIESTANRGIRDLTGLQHAVNLRELEIIGDLNAGNTHRNWITDASAIYNLSKLERLDLSNNPIKGIPPFEGLTKLTELNLTRTGLHDISAFEVRAVDGVTTGPLQLKKLSLNNNEITDISPLSGLLNLTHLYLGRNDIKDIKPLLDLIKKGAKPAYIDLRNNYLDITPGSADRADIAVLQAAGVDVHFEPQRFVHLSGVEIMPSSITLTEGDAPAIILNQEFAGALAGQNLMSVVTTPENATEKMFTVSPGSVPGIVEIRSENVLSAGSDNPTCTQFPHHLIVPVKAGETVITVTTVNQGITKNIPVVVKPIIQPINMHLNHQTLALHRDEALILKAELNPVTVYFDHITWESSNNNVVAINRRYDGDRQAAIEGVWPGEAEITVTVTMPGRILKAVCKITVTDAPDVFKVTGSIPAQGETKASTTSPIIIMFNRMLSGGNGFSNGISIKKGTETIPASVQIRGPELVIIPENKLEMETSYTVTVNADAVTDKYNSLLSTNYSLTFTTHGILERNMLRMFIGVPTRLKANLTGITWESSAPDIVTVTADPADPSAVILTTGTKRGTVTITATTADEKSATAKVVVLAPGVVVSTDETPEVNDVIRVLRHIIGIAPLAENSDGFFAADVSGSDNVDIGDVILILRFIVGLTHSFPVNGS